MNDTRTHLHSVADDSLMSSPVYSMGVGGGSTGVPIKISVPLYLDGKEIASATSEIQYEKNVSLKRALGVT